MSNLAVSLYAPGSVAPATYHQYAQQTNYLAAGDHVGDTAGDAFTTTVSTWFLLDAVRVQAPNHGTIIALGDSITEVQGQQNANTRWPNFLARSLISRYGTRRRRSSTKGWPETGSFPARGATVLVLADEDYTGVNPTYPAGTNHPKYAQQYVDMLRADKIKAVVWDIDADGSPHDLGVLSHFKGVVWYLGDNRLTQDAADEYVPVGSQRFPDSQIADREVRTNLSVRDYLNEGGKLLYTGETAGYFGPLAGSNGGGVYYGLKGHPERPCVVTINLRDDCELLADDFMQYYLGAYSRVVRQNPTGFRGTGDPLSGAAAALAGGDNPLNEAGNFDVTSDNLPVAQFPQFRSWAAGEYTSRGGPFDPVEGSWYAAGFLLGMHPWLKHYLTPGTTCGAIGTSGTWNRFTGNSGGWVPVSFDLSAYAGKKVEVSISYVTDPATGGIGAFVDDTRVTTNGGTLDAEGFESGLGPWTTPGAPAGSPANAKDFHRAQGFGVAAIATPDTLLLGFGLEQVTDTADRDRLMKLAMARLLR